MGSTFARVRVERGVYRQRNGKYAVCWRHAGRVRFRTVGFDLAEARRERLALIAATREGQVPVWPRLRFETVAGWWLDRFEAKVAAGQRHPRTLEAHRYQLERHLPPALGRRGVAALTVDDIAELLHQLACVSGKRRRSPEGCHSSTESAERQSDTRALCGRRDRSPYPTITYQRLNRDARLRPLQRVWSPRGAGPPVSAVVRARRDRLIRCGSWLLNATVWFQPAQLQEERDE